MPEVTIYSWIIKCLCTTIGETMSDNLMGRFAVGGDSATPEQLQIALYKVAAITVIFARHSSSSLIRRLPVASPGLPSRTSLLRTIRTVILSGDHSSRGSADRVWIRAMISARTGRVPASG
ncbi:MAG: hypothetical protein ACTHKL_21330 [Streptosporangiaceae bacterium]